VGFGVGVGGFDWVGGDGGLGVVRRVRGFSGVGDEVVVVWLDVGGFCGGFVFWLGGGGWFGVGGVVLCWLGGLWVGVRGGWGFFGGGGGVGVWDVFWGWGCLGFGRGGDSWYVWGGCWVGLFWLGGLWIGGVGWVGLGLLFCVWLVFVVCGVGC